MTPPAGKPTYYEIRVQGHLDPGWRDWFGELTIRPASSADGQPITILSGPVADPSELSGILVQINDMNLSLISVNPITNK